LFESTGLLNVDWCSDVSVSTLFSVEYCTDVDDKYAIVKRLVGGKDCTVVIDGNVSDVGCDNVVLVVDGVVIVDGVLLGDVVNDVVSDFGCVNGVVVVNGVDVVRGLVAAMQVIFKEIPTAIHVI